MEGVEAVGCGRAAGGRNTLTFVATVVFVPYEVYELTKGISALKVLALVVNLAIVAYRLVVKRLFGLRGGGKAERAGHDADTGWASIEQATPVPSAQPQPGDPGDGQPANLYVPYCLSLRGVRATVFIPYPAHG
jgi:hypothetical protein